MKIKRVSDAAARNFKMRLCHVSDTHGGFPRLLGRYDAVIHTGDLCPNSHHVMTGNKIQEAAFQMKWLEDHIHDFKQQLQGHTLLFILGNHDFANPDMVAQLLTSQGIAAINLTDQIISHAGVTFYGFPYVPAIGGNTWNCEREYPEMLSEVDKMVPVLNTTHVDVFAAHTPMHKCLDLSYGNQILGSSVLANAFDYKISKDMTPSFYLHGHIHESHGLTIRNGMLVSNAATTFQIIEV